MSMFDFIKDAGKNLFGVGEANAAEAIEKEVKDLGLDGDVKIEMDGDKVIIKGEAPTQEAAEKIIIAAGNVEGVAQVETDITVHEEGVEAKYHTVKRGDTLWAISKSVCGDGNKYNAIFEANKPMLSHPDKIYPGQVLRIPPML